MRIGRLFLAGAWLAAAPALAQMTTNNSALDALGKPEAAPNHTPPRHIPPHRPAPAHAEAEPAKPPGATRPPATAATANPPLPRVPQTPPAILAIPPPVVVPLAHPPPPPAIPVADDAPGQASEIKDGLRITFGPDRADLNPATVQALRAFAHAHADEARTSINLYAYASGSVDDPSTPRRLSLERALAARAVLLDAGIPSARIYPRALGPLGGGVSPDRVDVVSGAPTPVGPPIPESPPKPQPVAQGRAG